MAADSADRLTAERLGEFLSFYYAAFTADASYLWDVKQFLLLPWAWSFQGKRASVASDRWYVYIGRAGSKQVYETMQLLRSGNRLRVYGAKGSGKTIAVATVCSHLHQTGMKRIVYLDAGNFIKDTRQALANALMISFSRDKQVVDEIAGQSAEDLRTWCHVRSAMTELLVFVVDDVDAFDVKGEDSQEVQRVKADAKRYLDRISATAARVEVASVNSRARAIWESSDKAHEKGTTIWFDGPFDEEELLTWRGWSKLPLEVQKDLDYYTGGMPRLLQLYEEVHGSSLAYCEVLESAYTSKLGLFIWNLAPSELPAAVEFILRGSLSGILKGKVDFTCFYKKEGRYHFLCPYLARKGKELLIYKLQAELAQDQRHTISKWVAVIRVDLKGQKVPKRTPRIGWNVEGCVIDMMRFQKSVFAGDITTAFSHCYEYPPAGAYAACEALTNLDLSEGVLLVPSAFNERAVDVVFLKQDGSILKLVAVQITVSRWKFKSRKQSHLVWKQAVAPAFKAGLAGQTLGITEVLDEYWYVIPESIVAEKSQEEPNFQEVDEVDNEDEAIKPEDVPEEVIQNSINHYKCGWKLLAAVHPSLREFDNALDLEKPETLTLPKLVYCSGNTKDEGGTPCGRRARVAPPYYCTDHVNCCLFHLYVTYVSFHRNLPTTPDTAYQAYFRRVRDRCDAILSVLELKAKITAMWQQETLETRATYEQEAKERLNAADECKAPKQQRLS